MKKNQDSMPESRCSCVLCLSCAVFFLIAYLSPCIAVANEAVPPAEYIINSGDQLLISVVGHELTALAVVRPDGMINYPVVGDVRAAGLTIVQLSTAISNQLSVLQFYENPQVTVQLQASRQKNIYVFGDVINPGQKQFPRPVSVVEALAAVGGFKRTADLANARIIKRQKEVVSVDLRALSEDQNAIREKLLNDELLLEDGDVLIIPSAVKQEPISVIGYVNMPGQYRVQSSISLVEAIALAGGSLRHAANLKEIKIIKPDASVVVADVTLFWDESRKNSADSILCRVEPGDSVVVPGRETVNFLGSVKNQGVFGVDNEIDLLEALALSGIEKNANLKKLQIIRSDGERIVVNASKIWKQQGQETRVKLYPGDTLIVPAVFQINWSAISAVVVIVSTMYAIFK